LKISPVVSPSSINARNARTVSDTWQKHRVCSPVPKIWIGSPARARSTKLGMTIPYMPV
jgi:hypothetical protein